MIAEASAALCEVVQSEANRAKVGSSARLVESPSRSSRHVAIWLTFNTEMLRRSFSARSRRLWFCCSESHVPTPAIAATTTARTMSNQRGRRGPRAGRRAPVPSAAAVVVLLSPPASATATPIGVARLGLLYSCFVTVQGAVSERPEPFAVNEPVITNPSPCLATVPDRLLATPLCSPITKVMVLPE